MKQFKTVNEAYQGILKDVRDNYEHKSSPRGLPIREITDYQFRVANPTSGAIKTADESRNKKIASYTDKEFKLYNSGSNRVEDFAQASSFWNQLANPDGTVNSAYGFLIWNNRSVGHNEYESLSKLGEHYKGEAGDFLRTPWEWAKNALINDKDTRQAILRFSLPEHQWDGNKDQTCTMHGNFSIRDNKLNLSVVMRSNDIFFGLVYDMPWFVSIMERMCSELKAKYPELSVGSYTHLAHSMHMYERDLENINKMIGD